LQNSSAKNIEHGVTTKPTYQTRRARYEIDRCEPQNRAIETGRILFHALTKGHYPGTPVPENILSGLSNIGFWNAGGAQDWGLDEHRNEGIEIMFLLTSRQRTVELFLGEVESNPAISQEPWTINSMVEHCGMGVTAFSKYCRELVNSGPMEFLNHCRLERAAQQLREKNGLSITEIALACGFNSSQYFATRFRQHFKMSPSRFVSEPGKPVPKNE